MRLLPPYPDKYVAVAVGIFSLLTTAVALVVSAAHGSDGPPTYALESPAIFVLERAAVASAILIAPAIVIGHLIAGTLPSSVGRDGVSFQKRVSELSRNHQALLRGLSEEVKLLREELEDQ